MRRRFKENADDYKAMVYVGTYGKYNNGSIDGAWLAPAEYDTYEDFMDACYELHKDEEDPELMFQDTSGIPRRLYSESSFTEELFDYCKDIEDLNDEEEDAYDAYVELHAYGNDIPSVDNFRDAYIGEYESDSDLAYTLIDNGFEPDFYEAPEFMQTYFDYDGYGRDLRLGGDVDINDGYAFWANI